MVAQKLTSACRKFMRLRLSGSFQLMEKPHLQLVPAVRIAPRSASFASVGNWVDSSASPTSPGGNSEVLIGFIGLGNMGSRMAANLVRSGRHLTVYDRNEGAMAKAVSAGAVAVGSPSEVADASDVIITMLPSSPHVEEVYMGPKGILERREALRPSILIDASTVDPHTSQAVGAAASRCTLSSNSRTAGGRRVPIMLDAPVSGGVTGAEAATLTFMVGGEVEGVEAATPVFNAMGTRIVHCGPLGTGAAAKLCNNLALAVEMAAVAEALALGQKLGLDPRVLSHIFNSSSARCWSSDSYNPVPGVMEGVPSSRGYTGGFACQLMVKDLGLALAAAEKTNGAKLPLGENVLKMYRDICANNGAQKDFSVIYERTYGGSAAK